MDMSSPRPAMAWEAPGVFLARGGRACGEQVGAVQPRIELEATHA